MNCCGSIESQYNIDIMSRQYNKTDSFIHAPSLLSLLRNNAPLVLFIFFGLISMFIVYQFYNAGSDAAAESASSFSFEADIEKSSVRTISIKKEIKKLPVTQRRAQSPAPKLIGLIAGHRSFDSGASCDDGLTEVQTTDAIAESAAEKLRVMEIDTQTLDEFDPLLEDYSATALISIHIDSCDFINEWATGFKIAGSPYTNSSDLSICIQQMYGNFTQLPYHTNSITPHMLNYHAFNKIGQGTPAIIIEIGFLNQDRQLLTRDSGLVVDGLVAGIDCFLDQLD